MYGAIKRCTPLVNLVLSVVILKKAMPSALLISSIALITAGAFVASLGDLQFEPFCHKGLSNSECDHLAVVDGGD